MAPYGGVANSLPVLNKLFQWFMTDYLKIEGGLFRFHHKATSLLILIGFVFISFENFLDTKSIVCFNNNNNPFAKQFCWMHGHSYISSHLQGIEIFISLLHLPCSLSQAWPLDVTLTRLTSPLMWTPR